MSQASASRASGSTAATLARDPFRPLRLTVAAVERLSPRMRRVVLSGPELDGFAVPAPALGPYLKLVIPPCGLADDEVGWPCSGRGGRFDWTRPTCRACLRTYTVRRRDEAARTLTLDVVLHGEAEDADGPGSSWARRVAPGDAVRILGPGAPMPEPSDWVLLAGDQTGLPAVAYVLENLPACARGRAVIEVPDADEVQALRSPPGVAVTWLHRDGGPSGLAAALRALAPPPGAAALVFAGAEAAIAREIRLHARRALGLPAARVTVWNYWKTGRAEGEFPCCP